MNDMPDSTEPDIDTDPLAQALRQQWQAGAELDDAGFSLRVMAVLPERVSPSQRRRARAMRWLHWASITLAGWGAASLMAGELGLPLEQRLFAGGALLVLLILWTVPNRWLRP